MRSNLIEPDVLSKRARGTRDPRHPMRIDAEFSGGPSSARRSQDSPSPSNHGSRPGSVVVTDSRRPSGTLIFFW